jgi:hypothetical protein
VRDSALIGGATPAVAPLVVLSEQTPFCEQDEEHRPCRIRRDASAARRASTAERIGAHRDRCDGT